MTAPPHEDRGPRAAPDSLLERLLRSPGWRTLALAVFALGAATFSSVTLQGFLETRGREIEFGSIWLDQLYEWIPWVLLAEPFVRLCRWLRDRVRRGWLAALGIGVATLAFAQGVAWYDATLDGLAMRHMSDGGRGWRGGRGGTGRDERAEEREGQRASEADRSADAGGAAVATSETSEPQTGESSHPTALDASEPAGSSDALQSSGVRTEASPPRTDGEPLAAPLDTRGDAASRPDFPPPPPPADDGLRSRGRDAGRGVGPPRFGPPFRDGRASDYLAWIRWRYLPRNLAQACILLALGVGVEAFLLARRKEREAAHFALRTSRLETELATSQLGSLRRQLHPHFLFNALHSVGGLVRGGDRDGALRALSNIATILRTTLEHGEDQLWSVREELALVEHYLEIERTRFGERITVETSVADECLDARLPALMLLPFVENAVRHAVGATEGVCGLHLDLRRVGERLRVRLEDDGPGFPVDLLEARARASTRGDAATHGARERTARDGEHVSMGIANEARRLELMYGELQRLELGRAESGGARVTIELPWSTGIGEPPSEDPGGAR